MKTLSVFCSSKQKLNDVYKYASEKMMLELNIEKYKIAYGGGTTGLMGIVRKTWIEKHGEIISSNVDKFVDPNVKDTYVFDNLIDRQKKLVDVGDGYLILPGGYGTHYELLEVVTKNDVKEANKPIFVLNINNIFDDFMKHLELLYNEGFATHKINELNIYVNSDPTELKTIIDEYYKK